MVKSMVSIPERWEQFMKRLADDHQIDLNAVISELCDWAFSDAEGKEQFEGWLMLILQKAKLKTKQALQTKKLLRKQKRLMICLKKNPMNTETKSRERTFFSDDSQHFNGVWAERYCEN